MCDANLVRSTINMGTCIKNAVRFPHKDVVIRLH